MTHHDLSLELDGFCPEDLIAARSPAADWTDRALNALDLSEEDLFGVSDSVQHSNPDVGWDAWVSPSTIDIDDDEWLTEEDLSVLRRGESLRTASMC